ncbi:MAG: hypothetical protein J0L75_00205 [Spirochaetes bacterium]|nr:hypothetical protein [Spirochaetota bacterium]
MKVFHTPPRCLALALALALAPWSGAEVVMLDPNARVVALANTVAALNGMPDMYGNPATIGGVTSLSFVAGYNMHFPGILPQGQEIMDFHVSIVSPVVTVKKAVLSTFGISLYNRPLAGVYELMTVGVAGTFNFGKLNAFRKAKIQDLILGVRLKVFDASYKYNGELGIPALPNDLKRQFNIFNTDVGLQAQLFKPGLWLGFSAVNILPFGYGASSNALVSSPSLVEGNDMQMALGGRYDINLGRFVVLTPALDATLVGPPISTTNGSLAFGGRGSLEANFLDLIYLRLGVGLSTTDAFHMGVGMGLHLQMDKFVADVDLAFKWLPTETQLGTSIQTLAINVSAKL